jgi:23S rRNA (guanosine2251-2'-O)-methyltransferase
MKSSKLFGLHSVQAALNYSPQTINKAWIDNQRQDKRLTETLQGLLALGIEPEKTDRKKLDRLAEGNNHQGIVIEVEMPGELPESELKSAVEIRSETALFLVLDNVQDPHNFGA